MFGTKPRFGYPQADLTTGVVELECKPQPGMVEGALRPTTKFEGALARAEGGEGWKLTGKCESGGTFRVELVPEGSDHFSGLWRGEAIPDPSFDRVDVPTNPITWALSYGFDSLEPGFPPIVGAGYFDDAADIPDDPILGSVLCPCAGRSHWPGFKSSASISHSRDSL